MPETAGLMVSIKRLLSTLIAIAATRLELLANELNEERLHLGRMLLYFLSALFCFGMGILLLTMFVVMVFWDEHRLAVLGGGALLFLVFGGLMLMRLRHFVETRTKLFSASLAELVRDAEYLGKSGEDERNG